VSTTAATNHAAPQTSVAAPKTDDGGRPTARVAPATSIVATADIDDTAATMAAPHVTNPPKTSRDIVSESPAAMSRRAVCASTAAPARARSIVPLAWNANASASRYG